MLAAGIHEVDAYILEDGDLDENTAAERIAGSIAGENTYTTPASRGRANIYASDAGIFLASKKVNKINELAGDIGVSCLPDYTPVSKGKLLATIKIIPYGLHHSLVDAACKIGTALKLSTFKPFKCSVIMSGHGMTEKALKVTENRLSTLEGQISTVASCAHTVSGIAKALQQAEEKLILISGVSAISDRRDIVPKALEEAGAELSTSGCL